MLVIHNNYLVRLVIFVIIAVVLKCESLILFDDDVYLEKGNC